MSLTSVLPRPLRLLPIRSSRYELTDPSGAEITYDHSVAEKPRKLVLFELDSKDKTKLSYLTLDQAFKPTPITHALLDDAVTACLSQPDHSLEIGIPTDTQGGSSHVTSRNGYRARDSIIQTLSKNGYSRGECEVMEVVSPPPPKTTFSKLRSKIPFGSHHAVNVFRSAATAQREQSKAGQTWTNGWMEKLDGWKEVGSDGTIEHVCVRPNGFQDYISWANNSAKHGTQPTEAGDTMMTRAI